MQCKVLKKSQELQQYTNNGVQMMFFNLVCADKTKFYNLRVYQKQVQQYFCWKVLQVHKHYQQRWKQILGCCKQSDSVHFTSWCPWRTAKKYSTLTRGNANNWGKEKAKWSNCMWWKINNNRQSCAGIKMYPQVSIF